MELTLRVFAVSLEQKEQKVSEKTSWSLLCQLIHKQAPREVDSLQKPLGIFQIPCI